MLMGNALCGFPTRPARWNGPAAGTCYPSMLMQHKGHGAKYGVVVPEELADGETGPLHVCNLVGRGKRVPGDTACQG